ncbi:uncharacterized protein YALI1_B08247g [Yarrowia lipolytica]|uniref:Uncharacterized protein n=1 Tax=Yarrowia lipolytica TaxID=4952 RepID=A0A1D8N6P3_YARLL|nr:hypothetical protein YALI1_B08247g [Yarrowia lipolytica]
MTVQTAVHPSKAFRSYYPCRELHPWALPILSESSWTMFHIRHCFISTETGFMRGLLSLKLVITLRPLSACTEGFPFTRQLRSLRSASRLSYSLMRSFTHGFNQSQQLSRSKGFAASAQQLLEYCLATGPVEQTPKCCSCWEFHPWLRTILREGAPE